MAPFPDCSIPAVDNKMNFIIESNVLVWTLAGECGIRSWPGALRFRESRPVQPSHSASATDAQNYSTSIQNTQHSTPPSRLQLTAKHCAFFLARYNPCSYKHSFQLQLPQQSGATRQSTTAVLPACTLATASFSTSSSFSGSATRSACTSPAPAAAAMPA